MTSAKPRFPFADTVAVEIEAARVARRVSLSALARASGVSRRHLAELRKGANVTLNVLVAVMEALQLEKLNIGAVSVHVPMSEERVAISTAASLQQNAAMFLERSSQVLRGLIDGKEPDRDAPIPRARHLANEASALIEEYSKELRRHKVMETSASAHGIVDDSRESMASQPRKSSAPRARKARRG